MTDTISIPKETPSIKEQIDWIQHYRKIAEGIKPGMRSASVLIEIEQNLISLYAWSKLPIVHRASMEILDKAVQMERASQDFAGMPTELSDYMNAIQNVLHAKGQSQPEVAMREVASLALLAVSQIIKP